MCQNCPQNAENDALPTLDFKNYPGEAYNYPDPHLKVNQLRAGSYFSGGGGSVLSTNMRPYI